MSMTDIDQAVVEKALDALDVACINNDGRRVSWFGYTRDQRIETMTAALQAINLPDLLRKEREYDALMARVEAAPVGEVRSSGEVAAAIDGDSVSDDDLLRSMIGKRVRLLVEQEG